MAFTQAQLDAALAAYANLAERVAQGDSSVTYRALDDMAKGIATMAAAMGVANPLAPATTAAPRFSLAQHSRD